jgi:hypothetical protein
VKQQRLMTKAEIVQRLRALPKYQGLTMKAVAAATGVSRVLLYRARQGAISDVLQQALSRVLTSGEGMGSCPTPFPRLRDMTCG